MVKLGTADLFWCVAEETEDLENNRGVQSRKHVNVRSTRVLEY
jgi:hypothetical protein